jgi:hypothetical protein
VAAKGGKGSTIFLCTDGVANIGVGSLYGDMDKDNDNIMFYEDLANKAK